MRALRRSANSVVSRFSPLLRVAGLFASHRMTKQTKTYLRLTQAAVDRAKLGRYPDSGTKGQLTNELRLETDG